MSSVVWLYILLAVLILASVGGWVWLLTLLFGKNLVAEDTPLLNNYNSMLDNGAFMGEVKNINYACKGNRIELIYEVKDIDIKNPMIKEQKIYIENGKLISVPKGVLSRYRNILIALPATAQEVPGALKDTLLGKGIMFMVELDNLGKSCEDILRKGIKDRDTLLKDIGTGEISDKWVKMNKTFMTDYVEALFSKKMDNKNVPFSVNQKSESSY